MPTEAELNRLINGLQELLHMASDVSHDRCVKVLTARAKVRRIQTMYSIIIGRKRILSFHDGFANVSLKQDGSLERLSSAEFVSLSRAVERFVRDTEELCGRRSVSLRGALQSQANRFVNRFHEERKTKLRYSCCGANVTSFLK